MPQESTSATDREFAEELQAEVDGAGDAFLLLLAQLDRNLAAAAREDDDSRLFVAIALFLVAFDELVSVRAISAGGLALDSLERLYPEPIRAFPSLDVEEQLSFRSVVKQTIEHSRDQLRVLSAQTGLSAPKLAQASLLSRAQRYDIRKGLDALLVRTAHRSIHEAGLDIYPRKRAVAVLDERTTNLCRNRMDGQIRAWNEPYVDPVSGSQWMYPPFIGALLSPRERFHFCRTVSVPYLGKI